MNHLRVSVEECDLEIEATRFREELEALRLDLRVEGGRLGRGGTPFEAELSEPGELLRERGRDALRPHPGLGRKDPSREAHRGIRKGADLGTLVTCGFRTSPRGGDARVALEHVGDEAVEHRRFDGGQQAISGGVAGASGRIGNHRHGWEGRRIHPGLSRHVEPRSHQGEHREEFPVPTLHAPSEGVDRHPHHSLQTLATRGAPGGPAPARPGGSRLAFPAKCS